MRFVVRTCTCSIQLTSHRVNAKIAPTLVNWVKETRLSPHVGPTSCYCKLHRVNWPLLRCQDIGNFRSASKKKEIEFPIQFLYSLVRIGSWRIMFLNGRTDGTRSVTELDKKSGDCFTNHLQPPYSAKVKGVVQELHTPQPGGRHWFCCPNSAKFGTNDLHSMPFWKIFTFFQNFEIQGVIWRFIIPKTSIHCTNRTKGFYQTFQIFFILIRKHLNLNFDTKIIQIHWKLSEIHHSEAENSKFYKSNFEDYGALFVQDYFAHIVCPHVTP